MRITKEVSEVLNQLRAGRLEGSPNDWLILLGWLILLIEMGNLFPLGYDAPVAR